MDKSSLNTFMQWLGTFFAITGIILWQTNAFVCSLFIREYVYSELNYRATILCIVLTAVEIFAVYRLMKARFYVASFGKVIFSLYAILNAVLSPSVIETEMRAFSVEYIQKYTILPDAIISAVLVITEFTIMPILLCIFAFTIKKKCKNTGKVHCKRDNEDHLDVIL